jgi:serine/threonine protein phosphatase PrpC
MSTKQPDPTPPKAGGLWARLFGMGSSGKPETSEKSEPTPAPEPEPEQDEVTPAWTASLPSPPSTAAHMMPVAEADSVNAAWNDLAAVPSAPSHVEDELESEPALPSVNVETLPDTIEVQLAPCPACGTVPKGGQAYCDDCGWMFSNGPIRQAATIPIATAPPSAPTAPAPVSTAFTTAASKGPAMRLRDRYEILPLALAPLAERDGVSRFSGLDHDTDPPRPVVIVQAALPELPQAVVPLEDAPLEDGEEIIPTFEDPLPVAQLDAVGSFPWPGVAWEESLLARANHPGLPQVVETFVEGNTEYLIEAVPEGQTLWDAWDDPAADATVRYGWLKQLAEALQALHQAGAICESLRPDIVTITPQGQAVLADLSDLLPIPIPPGTAVRASLYTAPEVVLSSEQADARADLYGFGALLYALEYLHHALEEKDFERPFTPKQITDRYPDVHPGFFRLISKTFCRELPGRFPTDEAVKEDRTGFAELIRTLEVCRRTFDSVRFDIAAWTTTGMIRTGNEDAFSFLHGMESRQDELTEYAMLLLADGMGGYEAGEVAAALALQAMRKFLLQQPIFSALAGGEPPAPGTFSLEGCKQTLLAALKYANKEVHTAARTPGKGRRGMGCTAECVYVDNRHVVVGHVGDSRTYHLSQGRMIQLTRDQTLVNRLVELGQLTEEEAEDHPRKNELQQAIGGQPDVEPGLYHGLLKRGDWVLVCSDGLTNHVPAKDLTMMLSREAMSAEDAARRLMNLVNLRGATDNATIVVIRVS